MILRKKKNTIPAEDLVDEYCKILKTPFNKLSRRQKNRLKQIRIALDLGESTFFDELNEE
jgi:hypothetical protein